MSDNRLPAIDAVRIAGFRSSGGAEELEKDDYGGCLESRAGSCQGGGVGNGSGTDALGFVDSTTRISLAKSSGLREGMGILETTVGIRSEVEVIGPWAVRVTKRRKGLSP